jgi:hypothetical protein
LFFLLNLWAERADWMGMDTSALFLLATADAVMVARNADTPDAIVWGLAMLATLVLAFRSFSVGK